MLVEEGLQAACDLEVVRLGRVVHARIGEHAPQVRRKHLQAAVEAGGQPLADGGQVDGILRFGSGMMLVAGEG